MKIRQIGIGMLALALFLAPLLGGMPAGSVYGGDIRLSILRALVFLAGVLVGGGGGRRTLPFWLFAGWGVLSLLFHSRFFTSDVLLFAQVTGALDGIAFALVVHLISGLSDTERRLPLSALLVGGAITCLLICTEGAIFQSAGQVGYRATGQGLNGVLPIPSIGFFSPNFAAGFAGLCLPLFVGLALDTENGKRQMGGVVGVALAAGALAAAGSRSAAAIGLGGVALALALAFWRNRKLPWKQVGLCLVALLVLFAALSAPLRGRATDTSGNAHSGPFRTYTWKGTFAMAMQNPIVGTGPGTYPYTYPKYALVAKTGLAHNSYLQVAAEIGFLGLLALLVGIVFRLAPLRSKEGEVTLLAALAVGLLRSLFDSEWSLLGNALPFFALLGLLTPPTLPSSTTAGKVLQGASALALFATLLFMLRAYPPQPKPGYVPDKDSLTKEDYVTALRLEPGPRWAFPLARAAERENKWDEAIGLFQEAHQNDPNDFQTLRALAEAQEKGGRHDDALQTWRTLTDKQEGLPGQVRAIPERPDVHPFYAYVALEEWDKAAAIVEAYAETPPVYQQQEIAMSGAETARRRREQLRAAYLALLSKCSEEHQARREIVLQKLDTFGATNAVQ